MTGSSPSDDEDFLIEDEEAPAGSGEGDAPDAPPPWCLLVVDDEPGIHAITQLALKRLEFKRRRLEILSAYSGAEALEILRRRRDIAVILLDVVMETDDAGLQCVRAIRDDIGNREVRIILRTGQPGQAPEQRVILDYDINDYKAKTELTAQKLFTAMIAALRTYDHIVTIETSRRGLNMVIDASASLFMARSLEQLHSGVLIQLQAMIGVGEDGILCVQRGLPRPDGSRDHDSIFVLAASGRYRSSVNCPLDARIPAETTHQIERSFLARQSIFGDRLTTLYIATPSGREVVASFDSQRPITPHDRTLIELFAAKVSLGFENLYRFSQLRTANDASTALIARLCDNLQPGAGRRALRVAGLADAIAHRLAETQAPGTAPDGLPLDLLAMAIVFRAGNALAVGGTPTDPGPGPQAGPMEDDGSGWSDLAVQLAATAGRWDGTGGPLGMKGPAIPLAARITAVAERFASLTADGTLPPADALAAIQADSGTAFDPAMVQALTDVVGAEGK